MSFAHTWNKITIFYFSLPEKKGNLAEMNKICTPNLRSRFSKNPSGNVAGTHVDAAAACVSGDARRLF